MKKRLSAVRVKYINYCILLLLLNLANWVIVKFLGETIHVRTVKAKDSPKGQVQALS